MYQYIFGFALLMGGYTIYSKSMGPLDNTSALQTIKLVAGLATTGFFIGGFFAFSWWAPFAGFFLSMILWMPIQVIALKARPSLLVAMRSQVGMLLGIIFCIYGFWHA
jgi:hypothetical protein